MKSAFLVKMEELVRQVVGYYNISCYRIDSVIETHQGADGEKISVPVIRIIGFFEDTVSKLTPVLHTEFDLSIVKENKIASSEIFVSAAQTYLAGLKPNRLELPEYKAFGTQQVEIRVSSVLQDVYAAMQKELARGKATVPSNVIRDFYRIGALLETADIEFVKIRNLVNDSANGADERNGTRVTPETSGASQAVNGVNGAANTEHATSPRPTQTKQKAAAEAGKNIIDVIDMNVDSFNSLGVSIGNTESKNGTTDESYLDLISPRVPTSNNPDASNPVTAQAAPQPDLVFESADKNDSSQENNTDKGPAIADDSSQLNEATLNEFVLNSVVVKEVDRKIADRAGAKINDEIDIEGDVERLRFLKVFTLKQLQEKITDNKDDIVAFAEKWIGKDNGGSFDSGICLFYLEYLLVGKKNDPAFAVEYVLKFISDNDYSARYIIPTYNSIRQANEPSSHAHLTLK